MMQKKQMSRLSVNVKPEWMEEVDKYADSMGINRTSAVIMLVNQALEMKKALDVTSRYGDDLIKDMRARR